jgi:hypothetical protein
MLDVRFPEEHNELRLLLSDIAKTLRLLWTQGKSGKETI